MSGLRSAACTASLRSLEGWDNLAAFAMLVSFANNASFALCLVAWEATFPSPFNASTLLGCYDTSVCRFIEAS